MLLLSLSCYYIPGPLLELAMELWMMKLQGVLARAKPHDQLLSVEVLDSLLESLAPDSAKECLSSLRPEVRRSSLSLLARQYEASEEEARQWNANVLFSRFKYSAIKQHIINPNH